MSDNNQKRTNNRQMLGCHNGGFGCAAFTTVDDNADGPKTLMLNEFEEQNRGSQ